MIRIGFNRAAAAMLAPMPMMNRPIGNRQMGNRRVQGNQLGNGNGPVRGNGPRGLPMRRKVANGKVAAVKGRQNVAKNQKGQKAGPKNGRKGGKGRRSQGDRYQLSKPWVTDEIKAAHEKKVELAEKLKGNKNDELFAEFKVKRDEFVKLYDAARTEYNKNKVIDIH